MGQGTTRCALPNLPGTLADEEVAALRCSHLYHDQCFFVAELAEEAVAETARLERCVICRANIDIDGSCIILEGVNY